MNDVLADALTAMALERDDALDAALRAREDSAVARRVVEVERSRAQRAVMLLGRARVDQDWASVAAAVDVLKGQA